jgi:hypothetical protein
MRHGKRIMMTDGPGLNDILILCLPAQWRHRMKEKRNYGYNHPKKEL